MYIGKTPTVGNFQVCDAISVVNGQAAYTLQVGGTNVAPESANHMLVSLNGILQKPGSSFTISGSTMTFASNLATGDVIDFVQILGNVLDIGQPSDDTVTAAKLNNDIISGTTALTSEPATTDELLISDAGTLKRIDYSLISNRPAFEAALSANQSINDNATDKVQANTEILDTDSCYDNSTNYRFTPTVAGKYFVYARVLIDDDAGDVRQVLCLLFKNGSELVRANLNFDESSTEEGEGGSVTINTIVDMNGSSDYLELYAELDSNDGGAANIQGGNRKSAFGAFKLIGV